MNQNEIYKQAVRNTLTTEAAERLLSGDLSATDDAGHEAIEVECVRLTRESCEDNLRCDYAPRP